MSVPVFYSPDKQHGLICKRQQNILHPAWGLPSLALSPGIFARRLAAVGPGQPLLPPLLGPAVTRAPPPAFPRGDLRELPRVPLRGEGSCGGGGAPRDSAGSGATEEGLTDKFTRTPTAMHPTSPF